MTALIGVGSAAVLVVLAAIVRHAARGGRPKGQWADVVLEPDEQGAQDVVGFVSVDPYRESVKLILCAKCSGMIHRWRSWPVRRWSGGAQFRCADCARRMVDIKIDRQPAVGREGSGWLSLTKR